ncbi:hypothetical protein CWC14_04090 [Pseudoalteromonas sp. S3260]|nr:hypothetical protein CWC14_04090 [Pseudoalteromonas sp. S3260]
MRKRYELFFNDLEKQLPGMDGGNINAPLWLSGLEWAGADEKVTLDITRPTHEVHGYCVPYLSSGWKAENLNFYKWQFDQKIAKILCKAFEFEGGYKNYMKDHYCNFDSNEFKLNLFPLPCKNMNTWSEEHIELTKTKIKYHYQTHCSITRFKLFNALVKQFQPKVVVCFGPKYVEEYKMAFWGDTYNENECAEERVFLGSKNELRILKGHGLPVLVLAPFLGRNLVANVELNNVGEIIKTYL